MVWLFILSGCMEFVVSEWAQLHGNVVKAAATRHYLPFITDLVHRHYTGDDTWSVSMRKITTYLSKVYHILYRHGMFLPDAEKDNLQHAVNAFSKHMLLLRSMSHERGLMYFQVTPKVHLLQHIPYQSRLLTAATLKCMPKNRSLDTSRGYTRPVATAPTGTASRRRRWLNI